VMVRIKLKYLTSDVDRHGNVRWYVRLPGGPKVRIRALPGSSEFMAEYQTAVSEIPNNKVPTKYRSPKEGSFGYTCLAYYASAAFRALDGSTQNWRRKYLDAICKTEGHKPIAEMQPIHVRRLRDELRDKPGASKTRIKALRALFGWALENGLVSQNPTIGVKFNKYKPREHHTWTVEEVGKFEDRHPIGTKARLAMALLLYTACRLEDVVRLGPRNICDGRIQFRQAKNEHRNPVDIDIPLDPELGKIIAATPPQHMTFLTTEYGKPFAPKGFGNKFREWCNQAGLAHCSAHGLRKAIATRLAEAGATPHQIMAITGHRSLEEVERYTRKAAKKKLADAAMAKLRE
jgi:integrase/recombinase XerD